MLRERIAGVEQCTALRISGMEGVGAVASSFLQSSAKHANQMFPQNLTCLSEHALDILTLQ